mgnify:CR=1 FL=1
MDITSLLRALTSDSAFRRVQFLPSQAGLEPYSTGNVKETAASTRLGCTTPVLGIKAKSSRRLFQRSKPQTIIDSS